MYHDCVDYILHFRTHLFCRDSIYLCRRCNKAVRHLLCQEGLNPHNYSGFQIVRLGKVHNLQYSLLAIIFTKKTCPFFSILFCIFLIIIIWSRKKSGNRCDFKKIKYNSFLFHDQFQRSVLVLFAQVVSVQGVYVLGGKCPRGKCPGGICPRGYMS